MTSIEVLVKHGWLTPIEARRRDGHDLGWRLRGMGAREGRKKHKLTISIHIMAIYLTPPAATYSARAWERIIREH